MCEPICFCFEVYKDEIIKAIKKYNVTTVEQLQEHCKAGLGCHGCVPELEEIIESV